MLLDQDTARDSFRSANNSFLDAVKDDSKHKAVVSTKDTKKREIVNSAETFLEEISLLLLLVKD